MPLINNLNINYTPLQQTAIETAFGTAQTELETVIGQPLNLSDDERGDTPSVDVQRESFVRDAIETLGPQYPTLLGPEITQAQADKLWQFRNTSMDLLAQSDAFRDLLTDAIINAENLCLKFTEDLRTNAQRFKDRNVPGADVVWDRLEKLHEVSPSEPEPVNP
ncbi:MAG: hypothetical protein JJE25_15000 [Bacteroidia bacterium]|nr:hypothetical protein [Bacteroidia bacterium]